ncbi:MAG: exopolyphosphatase [Deltaproteobacteria bacterium]|nr:exopolyphosphatase [Deltaproteobacteria bacterium]
MSAEADDRTVAGVDLGSNSFHMIVARLDDGTVHVVDRLRERVRLAAGFDEERNLSDEAQERALQCLERFGQRIRHMRADGVRAVGTNTLRQAGNGAVLLERAGQALGHPIEIIAGREEARLIYLGMAHTMAGEGERRFVVDIGGGSTECIVGQGFDVLAADSLHMGCVAYSLRFFPDGTITKEAFREARLAAQLELEAVAPAYRRLGWRSAVGCSGTAHAIHQIGRANGWSDGGITPKSLKKLRKTLIAAGNAAEIQLPGLKEDRRPVIAGGAAIMEAVCSTLKLDEVEPSPGALREGLLYDQVKRLHHEDVRERTIRWFCERYGVDTEHAAQVEATALRLLDQVAEAWDLGHGWSARLLSWASRLFEIGLSVSHASYHKHGAYIVAHADMAGFSRDDQVALAAVIRSHRRKLSPSLFGDLSPRQAERVCRLCVLFRIALRLHRSRLAEPAPPVAATAKNARLRLSFPAGWLVERPLTQAGLEHEARMFKAIGYELHWDGDG